MLPCARIASVRGRTAPCLRLTAAIAVLAVFGACADDTSDADGESIVTFMSPVYGYSISHPASWSVVEADRALSEGEPPATSSGATDILGQDASVRVSTMQLPGVIIAAQRVPGDTGIDDWTTSIVDTVRTMKSCESPDQRDDIEIGGEKGTFGQVSSTRSAASTSSGSTNPAMKTRTGPRSNKCSRQCRSTSD
jgi:hypothetical protein